MHTCKIEKTQDSWALPYTGDSITPVLHKSFDYHLKGKCEYYACMCRLGRELYHSYFPIQVGCLILGCVVITKIAYSVQVSKP